MSDERLTGNQSAAEIAYIRRSGLRDQADFEPDTQTGASDVSLLIQRVAGSSVTELDNLTERLSGLRHLILAEGQRLQREVAVYAMLSRAVTKSARLVAESVPLQLNGDSEHLD